MELELIQVSVAGPAVLASVASGLHKIAKDEGCSEDTQQVEGNETGSTGSVPEKISKNTQMDLTSPL